MSEYFKPSAEEAIERLKEVKRSHPGNYNIEIETFDGETTEDLNKFSPKEIQAIEVIEDSFDQPPIRTKFKRRSEYDDFDVKGDTDFFAGYE